ncbi:hypothetical protein [Subtercola boreus]|uniref:hypothetical protein n=1 Tax=Subtercola boreus TaxID=120213 RepID=UPI0011C06B0A|nr:hypothetical protein [Subtercola boreus]
MRAKKFLIGVLVLGLVVGGSAAPATASTETGSGDVKLMVRVNGQEVPFSADFPNGALHLHDTPAPKPGGVSPNLINWDQWYGCFSLNHADDIFSTYYTPSKNSQPGRQINLRCGDASFGYKHIRTGKEAAWQNKFNAAKNSGWVPSSQGLESWDDLMNIAAGNAISYPNFTGGSAVDQTTCVVVNVDFFKTGVGIVYTFNARAAYSRTTDRLITAFPQTGTSC